HDMEQLRSVREGVIAKIAEIESCSDFPPMPSKLCDYCEYRDICPEFALPMGACDHAPVAGEGVGLDILVDELRSIDETLEYMMQRKKDIEQQLLQYSDRSGAQEIFGSTAIVIIVPFETVKMPEHYTEFLIEHGLLAKYGCVSSSKVRSAVLKGTADPLILNTVRRSTEKRVKLKGR
ncbi:MAG: PD-(D/E)XK nuclease family protein, partial [Euryarchaeota archaeon]|nr:PD-(D/E)XK nuclease family protein [Euryarchaeota archaeon]